jgi:hypothetical protein
MASGGNKTKRGEKPSGAHYYARPSSSIPGLSEIGIDTKRLALKNAHARWLVVSSMSKGGFSNYVATKKSGASFDPTLFDLKRAIKFPNASEAIKAAKSMKDSDPSIQISLANDDALFTLLGGVTYGADGKATYQQSKDVIFEFSLALDTEGNIGPKPTGEDEYLGNPRWAEFDKRVRENPDRSASSILRDEFADLIGTQTSNLQKTQNLQAVPPLPKKAPARWSRLQDRQGDENPAEFATRVYRVWMDAEILTRQFLKEIDPVLFASLDNWLKHNRRKATPDPLPQGFKLLTVAQVNDAWVERVRSGKTQLPTDPDELARFAHALQYRGKGL